MTQFVYGKNVVAQLLDDGRKIHEVWLMQGFRDQKLVRRVQEARISVKWVNRAQLDAKVKTNRHQGVAACIDAYRTYSVDEILEAIPEGKNGLIIMLDELEDPHNLGAILRSADAVGADGIIIGRHRSVSLTPAVAKVSTGAIDSVRVCAAANMAQTLQYLKQKGYWVVGADMDNARDYREGDYQVPLVLVIGSEGFGLRPLVKKQCDYLIRLPMCGKVNSLNASVACAVLLYKIYEQRCPL